MNHRTLRPAVFSFVFATLGVVTIASADPPGMRGAAPTTPHTPTGAYFPARYEGCTDAHRQAADRALAIASGYLDKTIDELESITELPLRPIPAAIEAKLRKHFKIIGGGPIDRALAHQLLDGYKKILHKIRAAPGLHAQCSTDTSICKKTDIANTFENPEAPTRLCAPFFTLNAAARPQVWIHELSHSQVLRTDHVYYPPSMACPLTSAACRENADSWGNYAVDR
jgi:hypothetical protein